MQSGIVRTFSTSSFERIRVMGISGDRGRTTDDEMLKKHGRFSPAARMQAVTRWRTRARSCSVDVDGSAFAQPTGKASHQLACSPFGRVTDFAARNFVSSLYHTCSQAQKGQYLRANGPGLPVNSFGSTSIPMNM